MTTLKAYIYDDLLESQAFRFLTLQPGRGGDPLECKLHTSLVSEAPCYEAISYVWGSDDLSHPVICDGKILLITRNLSTVLQRLRFQNAPRTLWADSICINQSNLEEKGHQVAIMSRIYKHAACVLIYLGEDNKGHGTHVETLLKEVTRMIDSEVDTSFTPPWNRFPYHSEETFPFMDDSRWASLHALLQQKWFTRGWVVREAAIAKQGRVIWGQSEFSWMSLMLALIWLSSRAVSIAARYENMEERALMHVDAYFDRHIDRMRCFTKASLWRRTSLLDYLAAGRALHMKDPGDRLYAFLDMSLEEEHRLQVDPKYGDTTLEVYHNFAVHYVREIKAINILDYISHTPKSLQSGIPTWVPSWDYQQGGSRRSIQVSELTSRTGSVCQPVVIHKNLIKVRGVLLDTVRLSINTFDKSSTTVESLAKTWKTVQSRDPATPYAGGTSLRTFFSALTEATGYGAASTWPYLTTHYLEALQKASRHPDDERAPIELDTDASHVHAYIQACTDGKKLIVTERNYIGLCPSVATEGDKCGIIFGCTMPCILRQTDGPAHSFEVLGPCFLLGKRAYETLDGHVDHGFMLGTEASKDWVDWDVEEEDVYLC